MGKVNLSSNLQKGDILQCNNNRTIALIRHNSKILLKVIAGRNKTKMDEDMNDVQAGFKPEMGTRNQFLASKCLLKKQ